MDEILSNAGESNADTAPPEQTAQTPIVVEERRFTQAEVNAIMANERRLRDRPAPIVPAKPVDQVAALTAQVNDMKLERDFERSIASTNLPRSTTDRLFKLYKAEAPDNTEEWINSTVAALGLGVKMTEALKVNAVTAPADSIPRSSEIRSEGGVTDLRTISLDQLAKLDPQKLRAINDATIATSESSRFAPPKPNVPNRK